MIDQPAHERLAGCKLGHRDVFVGLVGLVDRAGTADADRIAALVLEMPGLGAVGDRVFAIVAGQQACQPLGLAVDLLAAARGVEPDIERDAGAGAHRLHAGLDTGALRAVAGLSLQK